MFDRRDVIQKLSEWAGHRLTAEKIGEMTDEFLARPEIVTLGTSQTGRPGTSIHRRDGRTEQVPVTYRLDTAEEVSIYEAGGVLQRFAQDFLESETPKRQAG